MNQLGHTETGRVIVEMTREEWRELTMLALAVEGRTISDVILRSRADEVVGGNFDGVFGAIKAFYETMFRVNELQRLIDDFRSHLTPPERSDPASPTPTRPPSSPE
jgi:hypothetical protein